MALLRNGFQLISTGGIRELDLTMVKVGKSEVLGFNGFLKLNHLDLILGTVDHSWDCFPVIYLFIYLSAHVILVIHNSNPSAHSGDWCFDLVTSIILKIFKTLFANIFTIEIQRIEISLISKTFFF